MAPADAWGGVGADHLERLRVGSVMSAPAVTAPPAEPCAVVAQRMRDAAVSSVVVLGERLGIVTDRDLRTRLVAAGRSSATPVGDIATFPVATVEPRTLVGRALSDMLVGGFHHLPVVDGRAVVGVVTSGDVLRLRRHAPYLLAEQVRDAGDVGDLAAALDRLPEVVATLLRAGAGGEATAQVVAAVHEALVRRAGELARAALGPPPCPYGWLAFGSLGRREQTLHTDQDTGLLLPDARPADADVWFGEFAQWVTAALARAGVPRCAGGVMASEPAWRRSASRWRHQFRDWMAAPGERGLLGAEIAFDVRTVAGELDAAEELGPVIAEAPASPVFLARLARTVTRHGPPLRPFGGLAVDRRGAARGTLDVKARILLPITDLARLFTLARGGGELTTLSRLAAVGGGQLSADLAATLAAGYEVGLRARLERHVRLHAEGRPLDNRLGREELPPLVRAQLAETAKALKVAQDTVRGAYATALLGS